MVGVGERRRQRGDEAADRGGEDDGVAVQEHEPGVGVHRGEVLERDRVVRALERPPPAHAAALQDLEHRAVVLVGRALVDAEQPLVVAGHVGDRLVGEALEVLAHHGDALGGLVGLLVVHHLDHRVDLRQHRVAGVHRVDAWAGAMVGRSGRRNAVARFPHQQRAVAGILVEEPAEQRGAGAEHADHDQRSLDRLIGDVRVPRDPVDDPQPVRQRAGEHAREGGITELVELRVRVQRVAERRQPVAERVGPEVVQPGRRGTRRRPAPRRAGRSSRLHAHHRTTAGLPLLVVVERLRDLVPSR